MRNGLIVLGMLICSITSAVAQVSVGIGVPGISIGINLPVYPQMVLVPGYPVYYAPRVNANLFFYDGMYWVYEQDSWYASTWYNGPWALVGPEAVPLFILRVPVRYYRQPPPYFRGWRSNEPPRWGEHWGNDWEQHRSGWDNWNRRSVPRAAPLPAYQRQYSGSRYPRVEQQQQQVQNRNYRYQPRDAVVQQHYRAQGLQAAPPPSRRQAAPAAPRARPTQGAGRAVQRPPGANAPAQPNGPTARPPGQNPPQGAVQRQGQKPPQGRGPEGKGPQGKGPAKETKQGQD